MPSCLIVRPALSNDENGGDTIVYRRLADYVGARATLDVLELPKVSRLSQGLNLLRGLPPEVGGYLGRANRDGLNAKLARRRYDLVIFAHESTFPLSSACELHGARKVLFCHNVQSVIAESDTSLLGPLLRPLAAAFDRQWGSDPDADLICISRADLDGLRRLGIDREPISIAPPGAPPSVKLTASATVLSELVLTGSYGWWRKRRGLTRFAEAPSLPYPILTSDPVALEVLKSQARNVAMDAAFWGAGLRFGLITDRFQGGFKLKSLEYIAFNALLVSWCDLSREFEGLPHASEFVRHVASKADIQQVVEEFSGQPGRGVVARFQVFKRACLERYTWDRCLDPFGRAITGHAPPSHP